MTRLGKDELQQPGDIEKRYSQACGLAAFFIDGDEGRYREPLIRYLQAVYAGRDHDHTLADVTDTGYSELDLAYRKEGGVGSNEAGKTIIQICQIDSRDKVHVAYMDVASSGNAYVIFESLNDRGIDLSVLDLVKNYILGPQAQSSQRSRIIG